MSERWLAISLVLTSLALAAGCAFSGALASPVLPLTLAPVAVAAAAFGRSRTTVVASTVSLLSIVALATLPRSFPFPPIPEPWSRAMTVTSFAGLLLLAYAGVAGLVGAYVESGELVDRMRLATLEEAASRMRATEQVGAKVAHEIKNPLAAIKALLQLLRGKGDDKTERRVAVALAEVDRMDGIVRDYLDFVRPLADLEIADVDLRVLAGDVGLVLAARAEVAGVDLAVDGGAARVRGDARRLREALYNLADNAVAAAPRGGAVTLRVDKAAVGARLTVIDDGPGFPEELRHAAPFTTTREGGTGLGLTIARGAVQQHGGALVFRSRSGGGTVATVLLPDEPGGSLPREERP